LLTGSREEVSRAESEGEKEYEEEKMREARFSIGQVVRHKFFPFRGVIFDVDPVFNNSEEWWSSIPEAIRPDKDQPFYHLLAENSDAHYIAYVSEQNLVPDESGDPVEHPQVGAMFDTDADGNYRVRPSVVN
jgi:heat shock protein HspQ